MVQVLLVISWRVQQLRVGSRATIRLLLASRSSHHGGSWHADHGTHFRRLPEGFDEVCPGGSLTTPGEFFGGAVANETGLEQDEDVCELRGWISVWYDQAVAARFINPPFVLDETTADRLQGYFDVGLTPGDAVHAFFGVMH